MFRDFAARLKRPKHVVKQPPSPRFEKLIAWYYNELQDIVKEKAARKPHPLRAAAFFTPAIFGRQPDDSNLRNLAVTFSSRGIHFFEIWSDTEHTELLVVADDPTLELMKSHMNSVFNAMSTTTIEGYVKEESDSAPLLPPWLRPGLYGVVLNVRPQYPLRNLQEFNSSDDPYGRLITTLQTLRSGRDRVYSWISLGWTEYDWGKYASAYEKKADTDAYKAILGETYREPHIPTTTVTPSATHRQVAKDAGQRALAPHLIAVLRVALFSENPHLLERAKEMMKATLKVFGSASNSLIAEEHPLSATLSMMARRLIHPARTRQEWEQHMERLLEIHLRDVMRGREAGAGSTLIPFLLLTPNELATFVHLPVWSTKDRLVSVRYTREPTPFIEKLTPPEEMDYPIDMGMPAEFHTSTPAYIDIHELMTHVLIMGATGVGKTRLCAHILLRLAEAMEDGKLNGAIFAIDPEGRLGELWMRWAPEHAQARTFFFEPSLLPWGMNPLALPADLPRDQYLLQAEGKVSNITRMIKEVTAMDTGQLQWGHRLQYIIQTILEKLYERGADNLDQRNFTFLDVVRIARSVGDPEALQRLVDEMGISQEIVEMLGKYDKDARAAVLHKLERFVRPIVRNFICAKESLNFQELDQPGNIVFFSFKTFKDVSDIVSTLMGSVIMSIYSTELTIKKKMPWEKAHQTFLVVDEFHRTASLLSFKAILNSARNIRLSLWLMYQGIRQIDDIALSEEVFNEAHLKCLFRVSGNMAVTLKNNLELALGKAMSQRHASLPDDVYYLDRTAKPPLDKPVPRLIRGPPFKKDVLSYESALEYYTAKMSKYKPHLDAEAALEPPSLTPVKHETMLALESFKKLGIKLPQPIDYAVGWAVRDVWFRTKAIWPDIDELQDYISTQPWATRQYRDRAFILQVMERLKAQGYIREEQRPSTGQHEYCITPGEDETNAARRSLLLFDPPKPGGALGSLEHLEVTRSFIEEYVRNYMPTYIGWMPQTADSIPDGVLIMQLNREQWDMNRMVAVETHMPHHPSRAIEQAKKRFEQGYWKVIIVATNIDDEREIRQKCRADDELNAKLHASQLEIYTHSISMAEERQEIEKRSLVPKQGGVLTLSPSTSPTLEEDQSTARSGELEKTITELLERSGCTDIHIGHRSNKQLSTIKATTKNGEKIIVQCDSSPPSSPVEPGDVMYFADILRKEKANGVIGGLYITSSTFPEDIRIPEDVEVHLIDHNKLTELLEEQEKD